MVFTPNDDASEAEGKKIYEEVIASEGLTLVGWRKVRGRGGKRKGGWRWRWQ